MELTRRRFVRMATLGGGAALFGFLPDRGEAATTDALLLSCMDFRLADETERYMAGRGMRDKYDHVILAGASLGAMTGKFPDWGKTFFQHLDVAIQLHQIHSVIVLDHRDCGAYKTILGQDLAANRTGETNAHAVQLRALRTEIKKRHKALRVELLLMDLDGKVETVS
jgi:carbonic anhydrase